MRYIVEKCSNCGGRAYVEKRNIKLPCLICEETGHEFLDQDTWHKRQCKDTACDNMVHSDIVFAFKGKELRI